MKIQVIYPHRVAQVDASELGQLIQENKIMAFERDHKLVVMGIHRTRKETSATHATGRRVGER
jgi:hypothetical protein